MNEYLTVQEFAKAAGVSKQAIYKQMNSRLAPYVQTIKGQRKIAAAALQEFYDTVEQPNQVETTQNQLKTTVKVENSTDNQPETTQNQEQTSIEKRIDELEKLLQKQIEEDKQEKEFLKDQIRQKDKTIESLTENLKIAQQLAAADKKKLLEIEQRQQDKEPIEARQDEPSVPAADQEQDQNENQQAAEERQEKGIKAFFRHLFG